MIPNNSIFYIHKQLEICNVTVIVKDTRAKVTVMRGGDMNKGRKDVTNVKYSSNGRVFGVHAVDIY